MAKCDGTEDAELTLFNSNRFRLLRKQNIQLCKIMDQVYKNLASVLCSYYVFTQVCLQEMIARGVDTSIRNQIMPNLQRASVCLVLHLLCQRTGQELTIANIHVAWERLRRPDVQCTQAKPSIYAIRLS